MKIACSSAYPHCEDSVKAISVTLRLDNGTQLTSTHFRDTVADLQINLSRTAYRHPDGNAFIERVAALQEEGTV